MPMKAIKPYLVLNMPASATLAPSNLGDSVPGGNPPELNNNSRFLHWILMTFCMVVAPHKTNVNFYFWHDWMKDYVTVTSQKFELLR